MKRNMKLSVCIISILCIILMISPACSAGASSLSVKKKISEPQQSSASQYWALLFAVGTYEGNPDKDRPSMLESCDALYDTLLDSPQYWQASNIHVQKGGQCYLQNLIKELLWLRKNSRSEDYVFIYLTTHGYYLTKSNGAAWDLPPKDEPDGTDEFLYMYNGFSTTYGIIWDDLLNFFVSIIRCKGLCLVVDSCYSGGFNDMPLPSTNQQRFTAMSCQENEVSFGSDFSDWFINGLAGWGDFGGNGDGITSAEEAFAWAEFWINIGGQQHPTYVDLYAGELPLTYS
ncbi:MAG TPA: hypothetical protein HA260_04490 [Thermoplasmata archaeon]|nr:hypothetical protein [Thermoplasmata archaeon]